MGVLNNLMPVQQHGQAILDHDKEKSALLTDHPISLKTGYHGSHQDRNDPRSHFSLFIQGWLGAIFVGWGPY